jgi:hypothetical protein
VSNILMPEDLAFQRYERLVGSSRNRLWPPGRTDPVMKWQHDARTQIVHREDIAIKSPPGGTAPGPRSAVSHRSGRR